jgi:AcrR family transcriptional regulator
MTTRQEARDSQRPRLLSALMRLVAVQGYPDVTVAMIASEARVSLSTFYEYFSDKERCLLDAYDQVADELLAAVAGAADDQQDWQSSTQAGVAAYITWFVTRPDAAATFVVAIHTAGADALRRRQQVLERFRALLREQGCDRFGAAAVVATLDAAVHEHLVDGDLDGLPAQIPSLAGLVVAVISSAVPA